MALSIDEPNPASENPRALAILAKTIYRELRQNGYAERDILAVASELLGMVATDLKEKRAH